MALCHRDQEGHSSALPIPGLCNMLENSPRRRAGAGGFESTVVVYDLTNGQRVVRT